MARCVVKFALTVTVCSAAAAAAQHGPNFDAERKQANDLYLAGKPLEALPLYEDLCRQDATVAVFAERHGAGLLAKQATLTDGAQQQKVHAEAIAELRRAQALGDNSAYVRTVLELDSKSLAGAVVSNVPLTVGYTYEGKREAQADFQKGEAAFGRSDWSTAAGFYAQAAAADPAWYSAALFAGDAYFRLKDAQHAGEWFAKAIAIDPDRETAYRYWGDALFQAGDRDGAREKFVGAVVAEPYATGPYAELQQWAQRTGHQVVRPVIVRPEFTVLKGVLQVDAALAASNGDGRSSWVVYQEYRAAHGAGSVNQLIVAGASDRNGVLAPSGYRHSIAEEHAALRAMLADVTAKLNAGTLLEANLDPSIRTARQLETANVLGAWIAVNAADAGIRSDYANYRATHRQHLVEYVTTVQIR